MIKIGTCGYGDYRPEEGWKERYANKLQAYTYAFDTVELNRTFYRLPRENTARRWREEARPGFEFTVKVWQAVTHPVSSPTWRSRKKELSDKQAEEVGFLEPNETVLDAWDRSRRIAAALEARICVLQTPAKFDLTDEHEARVRGFFARIDRNGIVPAWEPRGSWNEHPERLARLCDELGIVHVVDVLRREPVSSHPVAYIRLHGLNEREYDYNYEYSEDELARLAERLTALESRCESVYCMFNNMAMYDNARRLRELVAGG
ncbi:MAG: DUF72 domain-containing protein [Spirochaetaceae bacterium]